VGWLHTPRQWCSSTIIGAPQSPSALLSLDWRFNISFSTPSSHFSTCSSSRMGGPQSPPPPPFGAPLLHSRLFTSLHFWRFCSWMGCSAVYALLNRRRSSLAWICAPPFHSAHLHHHQRSLAHHAHHIRPSFFSGGAPRFLPHSSHCYSNSNLIHRELTSISTFWISQIEPNDVGIPFHPLARP